MPGQFGFVPPWVLEPLAWQMSIRVWITSLFTASYPLEQNMMIFLQACFTILWSLWNHRNMVLHQGKTPNPMEVVLTSQPLLWVKQFSRQRSLVLTKSSSSVTVKDLNRSAMEQRNQLGMSLLSSQTWTIYINRGWSLFVFVCLD